MIGVPRLVVLLCRYRWRHSWNALRARPTGPTGLVLVLAVASSVAYVLLFVSALGVVGQVAGEAAQATALALMLGAIALASFGSKASAGDAVLAGSPENEFFMTRPVSISRLLAARSFAAAATDPFGALFLFPVLIAAAIAWRLPPVSWAIALGISICAQIAIAATAQTAQIAVVRWVPRQRRSTAWVALRLLSALSLASVWMSATWILRAPERLAPRLPEMDRWLSLTPAALLAAPLVALRREGPSGALFALTLLVLATVAVGAAAVFVARRAGNHGWEEAGAPWAERSAMVRRRVPLTPARREWRQLVRDRARLATFVALPAILVGVQIFGSIGWTWSTATLDRIAVLTFSVTLYMAAMGPLGHMQGERRAFWIMRTVPVPIGRLMAAKARAWSLILGGIAGGMFLVLAAGAAPSAPAEILRAGILVMGGTVGMTVLAVGLGCLTADLSDDQRSALGPGTVYLFLLLGGLYNLVLGARGLWILPPVALYLLMVGSTWRSGIAHLETCMDAEVLARRAPRLADGATLLLIAYLGPMAVAEGFGRVGAPHDVVLYGQIAVIVGVAIAAGWILGRFCLRRFRTNKAYSS